MDIRRVSLALLVALILSAGATYFVYNRLRSQRAAQPAMIHVVVASRGLKAGTALTPDNIMLIDWPANLAISGAITKREDALGRSLIYPVNPNQPVLQTDLAESGSGIGLAVKVPDGMRAISVRSNDVVGVAGFLYPGSHVDVLLTYRLENAPAPVTQTILQDVSVLTAGQTIEPEPNGKAQSVNVVTLLLNPQDAEKMVLASQQGTIQFVLRNGADQKRVDTRPALMSEMASGPRPQEKPVVSPVNRTKVTTTTKLPEFYSVETIAGEKHTFDKF